MLRPFAVLGLALGSAPIAFAHPHNGVDIIQPPVPEFPRDVGVPGRCEVRFDLEQYSQIHVRTAQCTDYRYCRAARLSVEGAALRVVDNNGEEGAGNARNVVYPIEFLFEPESAFEQAWVAAMPLFECDQALMF